MEIATGIVAFLSVVLQVFFALAVYFVLRYLLNLASEWHCQRGGKPLSMGFQTALCVLSALAMVL